MSDERATAADEAAAEGEALDRSLDGASRRAAQSRWISAAGVAAAIVIALSVNLLASRHYRRWDATETGLYTLSRVTESTLRGLNEPVEIYVLLSSGDPLVLTLRHLIDAYRAINPRIEPSFVDPDQNPAEFLAIQQKYGVNAAKTEGGRVVTDANLIVVRGDRKHFITADELFDVESGEEMQARPRVEQALTTAIQSVTRGAPPRVCITTGHGEPAFDSGGVEGLLHVRSRLEKLNYEPVALPPRRDVTGEDPIGDCVLVIVAGPSLPMAAPEVERLQRYVERGGNALVFLGPEPAEDEGYVDVGLSPLLALAGVRKRDDIVFELDSSRKWPIGQGEAFLAKPTRHPITEGLVEVQGAIDVVITVASSLATIDGAAAEPSALLTTSERAFGMHDFAAWAQSRAEPSPSAGDATGPLTIATATELPKVKADAAHGPRVVVVGTKSAIVGASWVNERLQGTGLFVESAISWLAAEPIVLDIPNKPARPVSAGLTEEMLTAAAWKVILLLPLASVLMGLAIRFRRRASEGRRRRKPAEGDDEPSKAEGASDEDDDEEVDP